MMLPAYGGGEGVRPHELPELGDGDLLPVMHADVTVRGGAHEEGPLQRRPHREYQIENRDRPQTVPSDCGFSGACCRREQTSTYSSLDTYFVDSACRIHEIIGMGLCGLIPPEYSERPDVRRRTAIVARRRSCTLWSANIRSACIGDVFDPALSSPGLWKCCIIWYGYIPG